MLAVVIVSSCAANRPASGSPKGDAQAACAQGYKTGQPGIEGIMCHGTAHARVTAGAQTKDLSLGTCAAAPNEFAVAFGVGINVKFTGTTPDYFTVILSGNKKMVKELIAALDGTTHLVDTERSVKVSNGGNTIAVSGRDDDGVAVSAIVQC